MKVTASTSSPPIGAVLTAELLRKHLAVAIEWGKETALQVTGDFILDSSAAISRYLSRQVSSTELYGADAIQHTEVDHWLSFSIGPLSCTQQFLQALSYLDSSLAPITYLVGNSVTIADLNVFGTLLVSQNWVKLLESSTAPANVCRWFAMISNLPAVKEALAKLPADVFAKTEKEIKSTETKDEGKFVDLPGAEMGKVVVRFPPEASGFLHIGHAKAALLNWYYKELFNGIFIMRFDDTNPDKEKVDFEKVILEDVKLLEITYDKFSHTSDHFPLLLQMCENLLKEGKAYVDDTPAEQMKAEREARQPSRNRDNPVEKNLSMWAEMRAGSNFGVRCCVRAKINMASDNGCMRDPTIYRCKNEPHPKTGNQYKVYPTYDFACPVVDSVEGVTHALRTMEYHDRDEQYYWFIEVLNLRKPVIWEYSRLNMMNTVLSKRKLTWFVEQGLVESWEDPRFPTVRGVLRRGMTVQGLKQFIIAQGSSRSVVQMEWDKIWAFNKKVIDPIAPRFTALEASKTVVVNVKGAKEGTLTVAKHPKNSSVGTKTVDFGPTVLIEAVDAEQLKEGENATFINWGNLKITKIHRDGNGRVSSVNADLNLSNTDYKKTLKITWLAVTKTLHTDIQVLYYDHIITKPVLGKDEDFKQYINYDSKKVVDYIGDPELKTLNVSDVIQLQRIGYFRVDSPCQAGRPIVLIHIPDGSSKGPSAANDAKSAKSVRQSTPLTEPSTTPLDANELEAIAVQWRVDREVLQKKLPCVTAGVLASLSSRIQAQGETVRELKSSGSEKAIIEKAVHTLLGLKADYKCAAGIEWVAGTPYLAPRGQSDLSDNLSTQADTVRRLKSTGADKSLIDIEVKTLLALKQEFKALTGEDWVASTPTAEDLLRKITDQGNKVRELKTNKATKADIDSAVQTLLALKKDYKTQTGQEWKPDLVAPPSQATPVPSPKPSSTNDQISLQIAEQGNKVRQLKADKAAKTDIDTAVKVLLSLKQEFKAATGKEWKPDLVAPSSQATPVPSPKPSSTNDQISFQIAEQGNKVRQLKADKAAKADIDTAVKVLLSLKQEFKTATGKEWTPSQQPPIVVQTPNLTSISQTEVKNQSTKVADIFNSITEQGNLVRELKGKKAPKSDVDAAVKLLLSLKAEYKAATGEDWKPLPVSPPQVTIQSPSMDLSSRIADQGNKVRQLKANKAPKPEVDESVKILLGLKQEFKTATGQDWKPTTEVTSSPLSAPATNAPPKKAENIAAAIILQGDTIRKLKSEKAGKETVEKEVKDLLNLKAEYKALTGLEWQPVGGDTARKPQAEKKKVEKKPAPEKKDKEKSIEKEAAGEGAQKKQTRLGLEAKKEENLPDWYSQVITKSEMIEYYDVSGCYILRPWAFAVWEAIQSFLDREIKKLGVVNAYFPMFVSRSVLEREKAHIADFAPEVAWVTKSGDSDLAEHIAIRPTSETAMYPAYSKWIQSHRDLPLRLNQWNNVVRWEFKHPQPFLRTREFLWQEGHTAFATYKEAEEEVYQILELYSQVYTDLLAVPVVKGRKTEKEKFAGGDYTTTVEAFISASGRGIQGATSHHLGHNFAKMFDICVEHPDNKEKMYVYQNSWGLTTRTIGVMIMVHADNQGLVLPPNVAALQVVIVPCGITATLAEPTKLNLLNVCKELDSSLRAVDIRSKLDERDNYSPGWKFNYWELKGVPVRIELGPKDLEKKQFVAVRRDTGVKATIPLNDAVTSIRKLLDNIHAALYAAAERDLKDHTKIVSQWADFCRFLDEKNILLAPFCEAIDCEENIKKDSTRDQDLEPGAPAMGAKSLCIPLEQPAAISPTDRCIHPSCKSAPKSYTLFGRSY